MYALVMQEAIRILYCSSESRFKEIFGAEDAPRLWDQMINQYRRDRGRFICELSPRDAASLANYTLIQLHSESLASAGG